MDDFLYSYVNSLLVDLSKYKNLWGDEVQIDSMVISLNLKIGTRSLEFKNHRRY